MAFCGSCGKQLKDTAKFCSGCGKARISAVNDVVQNVPSKSNVGLNVATGVASVAGGLLLKDFAEGAIGGFIDGFMEAIS